MVFILFAKIGHGKQTLHHCTLSELSGEKPDKELRIGSDSGLR
jgi:hypothetical protein